MRYLKHLIILLYFLALALIIKAPHISFSSFIQIMGVFATIFSVFKFTKDCFFTISKKDKNYHFFFAVATILTFFSTPIFAQCSGSIDGTFETVSVGTYSDPNYIPNWKVANTATDAIKIATQSGEKGAIIKNTATEHYSLQQTIAVTPSTSYNLGFSYRNWADGCSGLPHEDSNIEFQIFNGATRIYFSGPLPASSFANSQNLGFQSPAGVTSLIIKIFDPGSPASACGVFIDNITVIAPLDISINSQDISCSGNASGGSASLTVSGASPPYAISYSYNGGSFSNPVNTSGGTTNFSSLLAGSYDFKVADNNGCFETRQISINQQTLTLSYVQDSPILCNGGKTSLTLTASGGNGDYAYKKDNGTYQPSNVFNNIVAGSYTFTVKDNGTGCEKPETFVITEPVALTLTETHPEICNGGTSSVTLTATGGTGNKLYKRGTGAYQSPNVFSGLSAGTYTFYVKDANGCVVSIDATIVMPPVLTLVESHTEISCNGGTSSVTLQSTGGSGTKEYKNGNGPYQPSNIFNNVPAGNHKFYVKDANCEKSVSSNITEPLAVLILDVNPTSILCKGGVSTVTLTSTGGTVPKQYKLDNGDYQDSNIFNGLPAGSYTFYVKDGNNCTASPSVTISEPLALTLEESHPEICNGGTTDITLTSTGGSGANQFKIENGQYTSNNVFTALPAGSYKFYVKDVNDCEVFKLVSVIAPPVLTLIETHTPITCYGGTSSVTLTPNGGTGIKQYRNGAGPYQPSNIFYGLPAGRYTFYVKDSIGCEAPVTLTITQPTGVIALTPSHTPILCKGETSTVTLSAGGGTGNKQYKNGDGPYQPSNVFTGLPAGSYTFFVKDQYDCTTSPTVIITEPELLTLSESHTPFLCTGGGSSVTLQSNGGTGVAQYRKDNGPYQSTNVFTGLSAGNYTFSARDENNCELSLQMTIADSPSLTLTEVHTPIICNGGVSSVTLTSVGGSDNKQYSKDTGPYQPSNIFDNLTAGSYNFYVKDDNNCNASVLATITESPILTLKENHTSIFCNSTTTTVTLEATGGSGNNRYKTVNGAYGSSNIFNGIPAGSNTFYVKDSKGCEKSVTTNITTSPSTLTGNLQVVNTSCKFATDGQLTANVAGGAPPYSYQWSTGETQNVISNLAAASYQLNVVDVNGCTLSLTGNIINGNCLPIANDTLFYVLKNTLANETVAANASDPDNNDPLTFQATSQPSNGALTFNSDGSFSYTPRADFIGSDSFTYQTCDLLGACDASTTVNLLIIEQVSVTLTTSQNSIKEGESLTITAKLSEPIDHDINLTLGYSGVAELNKDYSLSQNYVTIKILAGDTTSAQYAMVKGENDAVKEDDELLIVSVESASSPFVQTGATCEATITDIYPKGIPSGSEVNKDINPDPLFSPNGDGDGNNNFIIYNITKYPNNEVIILNRWGTEVYRIKGYNNEDIAFKGFANKGLLTNSNIDLIDGVYYYIIYTTDAGNKKMMNKGYVILKR